MSNRCPMMLMHRGVQSPMDYVSVNGTRVRVRKADDLIRSLRRRVKRFELRYETPTSTMSEYVRAGKYPETAEVALWLQSAGVLRHCLLINEAV